MHLTDALRQDLASALRGLRTSPHLRPSRADRSLLHKNTGPFRIPLSPRAKNGLRLSCRSHDLDGAGISLPFNQFSFSCRPWTHRADRRVSDPGAWPLLRDGIFPGMWMTTMKKTLTVLAIGALSAAVGACTSSPSPLAPSAAAERATTGAAAQPGAAVAAKPGTMTIVGIVIQPDGEFDVLEAAVVRAGLVDALNGTKHTRSLRRRTRRLSRPSALPTKRRRLRRRTALTSTRSRTSCCST